MLMNAALLRLVLPIPQGVMMHDWWIALAAATFGIIDCVDEALILYRQHGGNEMGAPIVRSTVAKWQDRFSSPFARIKDYRRYATQTRSTLDLFRRRYQNRMPSSAETMYDTMLDRGLPHRALALVGARTGENFIKTAALALLMPRT